MAGLKLKMYNLEIFSSNLSYKINISKDLITNIQSNSIIIADDNLKKFFPDNSKVIFIHSVEQNKTLKSCEDLILSLSPLYILWMKLPTSLRFPLPEGPWNIMFGILCI